MASSGSSSPGNGFRLLKLIFCRDSYMNIESRVYCALSKAGTLTAEEVAERTNIAQEQVIRALTDLEIKGRINFTGINGKMEWTAGGYARAMLEIRRYYRRKNFIRYYLPCYAVGLAIYLVFLFVYYR
jgi:hypothetical protein